MFLQHALSCHVRHRSLLFIPIDELVRNGLQLEKLVSVNFFHVSTISSPKYVTTDNELLRSSCIQLIYFSLFSRTVLQLS